MIHVVAVKHVAKLFIFVAYNRSANITNVYSKVHACSDIALVS